MLEAPELTHEDVRAALKERLSGASWTDPLRRPRTLLAYFGTGQPGSVDVDNIGRFEVLPVRSELELREKLPSLHEAESRIAFLVPWSGHLPLDIQGRFASNGKIRRIGKEPRLKLIFGVAADLDDPAVLQSPLANYLVLRPPRVSLRTTGGWLTESAMWRGWLSAVWKLDVRDGLAGDALLAWAAFNGQGAQFVEAMREPAAQGVREALLEFLQRELGPAASFVWQAWEAGDGASALEWSLLFESLASSDDPAVRLFVKQAALQHCAATNEGAALDTAKLLGEWASGAVRFAETRLGVKAAELRVRYGAADKRATTSEIRNALEASTRLPSGWTRRLHTLGTALKLGAGKPNAETLAHAVSALRTLERHDFYRDADNNALVERADMATKLLAWLATDPMSQLDPPLGVSGDVDLLGRYYIQHGGYIDRARRVARGPGEGPLAHGVNAVLEAVDALRKMLDRRFARALVAWNEQGRQGSRAIPIDRAIERIAVHFLSGAPDRSLLVLLMDGMAWAQAVELLASMGERVQPWGPIAWHTSQAAGGDESPVPLVLANQPTLTDVSRAAFFAGKPLPHGNKPESDKDRDRFRDHPALRQFFEGAAAPKLMLRGEGHGSEGALSSAARELVRDRTQRVVALVVNAIDASLKADAQQRHRWSVDDVKSLAELMETAFEAGRTVLFCSDHGHVPAGLMRSVGAMTGGLRWRPWHKPDEKIEDHEVALSGPHVWTPKGAHGVVLLADETTCYGGSPHAGEHGGASLAEVVAPFMLIRWDDELTDDPALRVRDFPMPAWWHHDVTPPSSAEAAPASPSKRPPRTKKISDPKLKALLLPGLEPARRPSSPAPDPAVASPLWSSDVLRARTTDIALRTKVVRAVLCLRERGGACSQAALAAAMGEAGYRIGPVMSRVEEVLNIDSYPVLKYDRATQQLHLDAELLRQLFEVEL